MEGDDAGILEILNSVSKLLSSRFLPIVTWLWCTLVSCLIVGRGFPPIIPTLMSMTAMFFIASSVYIYNDINDIEIDKIHPYKKDRPIPIGEVPIEDAIKLVYIFGIIGLVISLLININCFIFTFIFFFVFMIYSYPKVYLKKMMFVKESVPTLGMILTSLVGSYAISNTFSPKAFFASAIIAIYGFTGQPAMLDTVDMEQDRLFGVKSLATVLSWKRKIQLLITGILIIMTLTPLTYVYFGFNVILPIFVVLGGLIVLRYMFLIMNTIEQATLSQAFKVIYIFTLLIQIFSIIGSLNLHFIF